MSPGVSIQTVSFTVAPGQATGKEKYELEFKKYLASLDASRILLDTRGT
jgi:hypothetical protein